MSELKDVREEQSSHFRLHDRVENDYLELKTKVDSHEIRIKALEPVMAI